VRLHIRQTRQCIRGCHEIAARFQPQRTIGDQSGESDDPFGRRTRDPERRNPADPRLGDACRVRHDMRLGLAADLSWVLETGA
jgi:hypothetical protein